MAFTTTSTTRSVPVWAVLCLLVIMWSCAHASSSSGNDDRSASPLNSLMCDQVRELFEGGIGYPTALHSRPEHESDSSLCRRAGGGGSGVGSSGSQGPAEYTCCSLNTERSFADTAEKRLKGSVRHHNNALKKRLNNVLASYQERLRQLNDEAENRTAAFLSHLHRIPWAEHRPVVANLYRGLRTLALVNGGSGGHGLVMGSHGQEDEEERDAAAAVSVGDLEDVVRDFFVNLFPAVFSYVLSKGPQERRPVISPEYHACLKRYADQIQPFGNQPERLTRHLRRSLHHARAFQQTLTTLSQAITTTETAPMDGSCRRALLRLQVCPGCRGVSVLTPGVKPCRGLCLNTMRGCLAKMFEVSSAWDDLVVAFQNLQVGLVGQHDLQKLLIYLDMNVSDAIMTAMTDTNRIYDEVQVKCQDVPLTTSPPLQPGATTAAAAASPSVSPRSEAGVSFSSSSSANNNNNVDDGGEAAMAIAPRNTQVLRDFRQQVRGLVKVLENSKGSFNRLPDSLCEDQRQYAQDMLSDVCWNGTGVGRYMEEVPEANFLSQVMRNKEVKVNLTDLDPSFRFLQVKESLTHMRRALSSLLNMDIMQGDSPYGGRGGMAPLPPYNSGRVGSGGGMRLGHTDVIVDDEDLVAYGSGSGSGSGDDGNTDEGGDGGTSRTEEPIVTRRPSRPPPSAASSVPALSAAWLAALGLCLHSLLHTLH